ncbi:hypothetical protein [uncultured Roseobacter sp.]|uniref:hypothetical protein n=1 Tax=uncultured Roseobacter sp. TaxID=114847 RepID=UPI00261C7AA5|nr:hypothetical protein [uncultured Roseobacter sp.]
MEQPIVFEVAEVTATMNPDQAANGLVPRGIAFVDLPEIAQKKNVFFVLIPQCSMSAFSKAIEPLRIANQLTGKPLHN